MRDYEKETAARVEFIRGKLAEAGAAGVVYGNSGGKDSALAGILCKLACENTVGICLPCESKRNYEEDMADGLEVAKKFGIETRVVDLTAAKQTLTSALEGVTELNSAATTNINPRLRMTTLYAISQSNNGRVVNTCNLSEDWVGYSTRYGDAAGDFSPLGGLTVQEVVAIGKVLGLPLELVEKAPSDGLTGKTDEDNLGFTYAVLDKYIRTGVCEDEATKALIDHKHVTNLFKLKPIPHFEPEI